MIDIEKPASEMTFKDHMIVKFTAAMLKNSSSTSNDVEIARRVEEIIYGIEHQFTLSENPVTPDEAIEPIDRI